MATTKMGIKERIRLEALNQANGGMIGASSKEILERAKIFEDYILSGTVTGDKSKQ